VHLRLSAAKIMSTIRTFVAVEIPEEIRHRAAALVERLRVAQAKVRWTDLASIHWTMNFLGDVPDTQIPAICDAVAAAAKPFTPFDLIVRGVGAFPGVGRPRTIWLGAGEGKEPLVYLQTALERQLATLGFRPESRRFQPHLTLGRVRDASAGLAELAELLRKHADFDAGPMPVDEVVVFSSRLEKTGAVHERLGSAPLAGR
jgi:2'-5' RNA ligase